MRKIFRYIFVENVKKDACCEFNADQTDASEFIPSVARLGLNEAKVVIKY